MRPSMLLHMIGTQGRIGCSSSQQTIDVCSYHDHEKFPGTEAEWFVPYMGWIFREIKHPYFNITRHRQLQYQNSKFKIQIQFFYLYTIVAWGPVHKS